MGLFMILRPILFLSGQKSADAAFVPTDSLERLRPELNPDKLYKLCCIQAISCQNGGCEKDLFKKKGQSEASNVSPLVPKCLIQKVL